MIKITFLFRTVALLICCAHVGSLLGAASSSSSSSSSSENNNRSVEQFYQAVRQQDGQGIQRHFINITQKNPDRAEELLNSSAMCSYLDNRVQHNDSSALASVAFMYVGHPLHEQLSEAILAVGNDQPFAQLFNQATVAASIVKRHRENADASRPADKGKGKSKRQRGAAYEQSVSELIDKNIAALDAVRLEVIFPGQEVLSFDPHIFDTAKTCQSMFKYAGSPDAYYQKLREHLQGLSATRAKRLIAVLLHRDDKVACEEHLTSLDVQDVKDVFEQADYLNEPNLIKLCAHVLAKRLRTFIDHSEDHYTDMPDHFIAEIKKRIDFLREVQCQFSQSGIRRDIPPHGGEGCLYDSDKTVINSQGTHILFGQGSYGVYLYNIGRNEVKTLLAGAGKRGGSYDLKFNRRGDKALVGRKLVYDLNNASREEVETRYGTEVEYTSGEPLDIPLKVDSITQCGEKNLLIKEKDDRGVYLYNAETRELQDIRMPFGIIFVPFVSHSPKHVVMAESTGKMLYLYSLAGGENQTWDLHLRENEKVLCVQACSVKEAVLVCTDRRLISIDIEEKKEKSISVDVMMEDVRLFYDDPNVALFVRREKNVGSPWSGDLHMSYIDLLSGKKYEISSRFDPKNSLIYPRDIRYANGSLVVVPSQKAPFVVEQDEAVRSLPYDKIKFLKKVLRCLQGGNKCYVVDQEEMSVYAGLPKSLQRKDLFLEISEVATFAEVDCDTAFIAMCRSLSAEQQKCVSNAVSLYRVNKNYGLNHIPTDRVFASLPDVLKGHKNINCFSHR